MTWIILASLISCTAAESGNLSVISFQSDGLPSMNSFLDAGEGALPPLTQVTLCCRFRLRHGNAVVPFVSYFGGDYDNELVIGFQSFTDKMWIECCNGAVSENIPFSQLRLYVWQHMCVSLDLPAGELYLAYNGELQEHDLNIERSRIRKRLEVAGGGRLIVGQELDSIKGEFDIAQAMDGEVTDYRLYDVALTPEELVMFTSCREEEPSSLPSREPLITLDNGRLEPQGMVTNTSLVMSEICRRVYSYEILIPKKDTFNNTVIFCRKLKATVAVPKDAEENRMIFNKFQHLSPYCQGTYKALYWVGALGNLSTGGWNRVSDGEPLLWHNFSGLSRTFQRPRLACITVGNNLYPYEWWQTNCDEFTHSCAMCNFTSRPLLRLRGLCKSSLFERELYLNDYENERPKFDGMIHSQILWENSSWVMVSRLHQGLRAVMDMGVPGAYPIGLHNWSISGDKCIQKRAELLLTACSRDEYTCGEGTCISKSRNCNLITDCPDQTDELNCKIVIVPRGYSEELSPPRDTLEPLAIHFLINITSIRTFDLSAFAVAIDAIWHTKWHDSRLTFSNLQSNYQNNKVKERQKLWTPKLLVTDGTQSLVEGARVSGNLYVIRGAEPMTDNNEMTIEDDTYSGEENTLLYQQQDTLEFRCHFELRMYPFDTQTCSLTFSVQDLTHTQGVLLKDGEGVVFAGQRQLLEYKLEREAISQATVHSVSVLQVQLELRNQYRYYLANAFLPSLMLVLICCLTLCFDIEDFSDRIMVTLTSMLVLAAFFAQTSQSNPKTSYVKLIDVWYLALICGVFFIILALVYVEYIRLTPQYQYQRVNVAPTKGNSFAHKGPLPKVDSRKKAILANRVFLVIFLASISLTVVCFVVVGTVALNA
ncbi:uncharacterized protein [Panulirus ornatus]|uniref:uncharacterized protein n=1 Tax=Panulirus ornatus TaxID=150431 RepID=UPI003A8B65A8